MNQVLLFELKKQGNGKIKGVLKFSEKVKKPIWLFSNEINLYSQFISIQLKFISIQNEFDQFPHKYQVVRKFY